jgi:hypothetical protein
MPTAPPEFLFALLNAGLDKLVGVRLFTCFRFDLSTGQAERVETIDSEAYPLTGLKAIVPNRSSHIVFDGSVAQIA